MSSTTQSQTNANNGNAHGNNNRRNRNRGGKTTTPKDFKPATNAAKVLVAPSEEVKEVTDDKDKEEVCWICAEPIKYYALPACNHRTCHVCSLRLRALYKKMDCAFCKDAQPTILITTSPSELFSAYTPLHTPFKDPKLEMYFESQEMMHETLFLLRFNCPSEECDYVGTGWADLKLHSRAAHGLVMCDLCIRSKKIFAHEHILYHPSQLPLHLPSIARRSTNHSAAKISGIEGGTHPLCEFCRECFFGDDELYAHMREKHEECFVCKREGVQDQYFTNYAALEHHFTTAHHACTQPACVAQKFVVFASALDLRAHVVEAHGGENRVVGLFEFDSRAGTGNRRQQNQQQERHQHPHQQQQQQQQNQARVQVEPQPQPPGGGGSRRREAFGGTLTTANADPSSRSGSRGNTPAPASTPGTIDEEAIERYLTRLPLPSPQSLSSLRLALRSYRTNESSARDLVSVLWNVVARGEDLGVLAGCVNGVVDLLGELDGDGGEDKRKEVLAAWRGFEVEQRRHFPDLVPTLSGTSTSSSSRYAAATTGRIINSSSLKKTNPSRQVWDRVAQAAASTGPNGRIVPGAAGPSGSRTDRFPPLKTVGGPMPTVSAKPAAGSNTRTPWAGSSANAPSSNSTSAFPAMSSSTVPSRPSSTQPVLTSVQQPRPPKLTNPSLFPELPTSANARQKVGTSGNVSLKNILGSGSVPEANAWGGASGGTGGNASAAGDEGSAPTGGKGKKGKGKQKQTLFTLGSFPT